MQKKVYVDTSSLILLTNINELSILKLVYESVYITIPILEEFKHKVPWWINLDKEKYNTHREKSCFTPNQQPDIKELGHEKDMY